MTIVQTQLAAAVAERDRTEAQVWARAGLDVPYPSDREQMRPYLAHLEAMMQSDEQRHWRAICIAIEELEKHLP